MQENKTDLSAVTVTNFLAVNRINTRKGTANHRENRPNYALVLKYEGETEYTGENGRVRSDLTNAVVLPMGCTYDWKCIKTGRCYLVEFEAEPDMTSPVSFSLTDADADKLLHKIERLSQVGGADDPTSRLEAIKSVYDMLLLLLRSSKTYMPSEKFKLIRPAVEYIHLHYTENIEISELGRMLTISTVYFRKLFRSFYGMSPLEYIQKLRIDQAKKMLCSDYGTLTDIALSLGYPNMYYFSRVFKSAEGVSPSKYKNKFGI